MTKTFGKVDDIVTVDVPVSVHKTLLPQLQGRTLFIDNIGQPEEPQINPNEILFSVLDHVHDGNREELVGQLILMLGWLHKGGDMPNISKDTVTKDTIWIIPMDHSQCQLNTK